jgi:tyrosinase
VRPPVLSAYSPHQNKTEELTFWFATSNVDRLWAIWQDLNPDSNMSPRPAPYATFSATAGQSQTKDTPLAPFWDKSGTKFWTSAQIKDTTAFGYAYPETQKWRFAGDTGAYQAEIRRSVTALYGTNVFANFVANVAQRKEQHEIAVSALAAAASNGAGGGVPAAAAAAFAPHAQTVFAAAAVAPPNPGHKKPASNAEP